MNIENIVLARKLSVLEFDAARDKISIEEATLRTSQMGADGDKILQSHLRQMESEKKVLHALASQGDALQGYEDLLSIIRGDAIPKTLIMPNTLVIALGGDNYFQYVSHFLENQPLVGINSDPENSDGALTYFTAESFVDFIPKLESGKFNTEEWTRLQASLNDKKIPTLATSEIYIGAYKSTDMSRYILELRKGSRGRVRESEEQKSSGLVVSTKAGETGWYDAASRYATNRSMRSLESSVFYTDIMLGRVHNIHPVEDPQFRSAYFIAREPFVSSPEQRLKNYHGYIREKETIHLTWLAHGKGLVSIDARDEYEITRGDIVEIKISNTPLRVVTP